MNLNARVTRRWVARMSSVAAIALVTTSGAADTQRDTPAEGRLSFEAATIKLAAAGAVRNQVVPTSPNRLYIPSMTLTALIYNAYGDGGFNTSMRVTGGPDWINRAAFAVEGVASGDATPRQLRLMLQTLLEERFALKIRSVSQSADIPMGDVLDLVVDRSDGTLGPKVKRWDGTCPPVMPVLYSRRHVDRCRRPRTSSWSARLRRRTILPCRTVPPVIEPVGYESTVPRSTRSQRCSRCRRRGRCWAPSRRIAPA